MDDRRTLGASGLVVAALAIAALATHAAGNDGPEPPARAVRKPPPSAALNALRDGEHIDLNSASASALQLLPGIGPALSRRIVEDREAHGAFETVDALTRVRGIGPRTVGRVRALLRVHSSKTNTTAPSAAR
jgi:competence protein ComEA